MPILDSNALVSRWFDSLPGVSPDTLARVRTEVQRKMESGACRHLLPKASPEVLAGYELQCCVEAAITEQWDSLTPDERLLIRFPTTRQVGEHVELPKRGVGTIIRRELTPRFGVLLTFRLADGSLFPWEFFV